MMCRGSRPIAISAGMGYAYEVRYLLDCITADRRLRTVTIADACEALRLVEAEVEAVRAKKHTVTL